MIDSAVSIDPASSSLQRIIAASPSGSRCTSKKTCRRSSCVRATTRRGRRSIASPAPSRSRSRPSRIDSGSTRSGSASRHRVSVNGSMASGCDAAPSASIRSRVSSELSDIGPVKLSSRTDVGNVRSNATSWIGAGRCARSCPGTAEEIPGPSQDSRRAQAPSTIRSRAPDRRHSACMAALAGEGARPIHSPSRTAMSLGARWERGAKPKSSKTRAASRDRSRAVSLAKLAGRRARTRARRRWGCRALPHGTPANR